VTGSPAIRLTALGWKARDALARSGGHARVFATLSGSVYLAAGDEIVWLGRSGAALHARAMLTDALLPSGIGEITVEASGVPAWRAAGPHPPLEGLAAGGRTLLAAMRAAHRVDWQPRGLGTLLVGTTPPFPLGGVTDRVVRLAGVRHAAAAPAAAIPLLGLGPGLTPGGDDLVGAFLFARRLMAAATQAPAWQQAAAAIVRAARDRTHPISLALLADLAGGDAYAPLHDLTRALAAPLAPAMMRETADRLTSIGHSSGWDMLAGLLIAVLGPEAIEVGGTSPASPAV
jgi:hypothetical protein